MDVLETWKRVARYTMLRLVQTGELDSEDRYWIKCELANAGESQSEIDNFVGIYYANAGLVNERMKKLVEAAR
jgi:hypothetical protein